MRASVRRSEGKQSTRCRSARGQSEAGDPLAPCGERVWLEVGGVVAGDIPGTWGCHRPRGEQGGMV